MTDHIGAEAASRLLPQIKALDEDFYTSNAWTVAANLQEMGKMASEEFKRKHPSVPDEVVKAFAWRYMFDYK